MNLKKLDSAESRNAFLEKTDINIIPGKFRIFHAGHLNMIDRDKMNFIVVICPKYHNRDLKTKIIESCMDYNGITQYKIFYHPDGYVPSIFSQLYKNGMNVTISSGSDRIDDYKRQFKGVGWYDDKDIVFTECYRAYSSTELIDNIENKEARVKIMESNPWIDDSLADNIIWSYGK